MRPVWCVQYKHGWCATFRGHRPSEDASSDRTACGHFIILRIGSAIRRPTCEPCREAIKRRRKEST